MTNQEKVDERYAELRKMTKKQLEASTGSKVPHAFMANYYFCRDVLVKEFGPKVAEACFERYQKSF